MDILNGYAHPVMSALGRDLRRIAERFENSREREEIRETVNDVSFLLDCSLFVKISCFIFNFVFHYFP